MKSTAMILLAAVFAATQALAAGAGGSASEWKGADLKQSEVRQIQETLNEIGFDAGPVDGLMGPHTRSALRNFQDSKGILVTGNLNEQTVRALGLNPAEFARFEETPPKAAELDAKSIRKVQEALNDAGYNAGPVDGVWGEQTRGAVRNYQQAKGIEPTGELNQDTLLSLGFSLSEFAAGEFAKVPEEEAEKTETTDQMQETEQ